MVDHDVELFARRPQRLVDVGPQRRDLVVGRHARQQHAAGAGRLPSRIAPRPARRRRRSGGSARCRPAGRARPRRSRRASGCAPAARPIGVRTRRRSVPASTSAPDGKKGGIVLGNSTSATMPSASSSESARVGIPVAIGVGSGEILEGVAVGLRPRVELVVPARLEVLAVRRDGRARVTVGRDDRVTIGAHFAGSFHSRK